MSPEERAAAQTCRRRLGGVSRSGPILIAACLLSAVFFAAGIRIDESHRLPATFSTMTALACDPTNCKCVANWDNCTGQDPAFIGCTANYTAFINVYYTSNTSPVVYYDYGEAQNRYATNCASNWGRTYTDYYADPIYASISGTDAYGHGWSNTNGYVTAATVIWSLMIYSPVHVTTACGGFPYTSWQNTVYGPNYGCVSQ